MLLLLLFITLPGLMNAQPGKASKSTKSVLKQAKEHIGFEEYQQAIPHLEELVRQEPGNAYYNFWLGKCLFLTYKKNQSLKYFEAAERANPDVDPEFHYWYGLALHYNLKFDRATEEYRKDLERYQPDSDEYKEVNNRIAQCAYAKKVGNSKEGDLVKINNLGPSVNTEYAEHSPVISGDGKTLYFTARRPDCLGAQPEIFFFDEDIYVAKRVGEKDWTEPVNISTPVNSKGHDATISLTADADRLYLYRHKKAGGLYVTDLDSSGNGWKEPRAIDKPLNSKYYETTICESADGKMLFFTSDRPGGYGGKDIYMVTAVGEKEWSEPQNLGPIINGPFDEDAPYFHPDGRTLYFSSNGPRSIGGYDIFVTEIDPASHSWLPPLNMGTPVNTPDDDIYFVLSEDGLNGFYASGKEGGYGEKDIYEMKFPYFRYPKRYYALKVLGLVEDSLTHDTLNSMVRLVDAESGKPIDSMMTTSSSRKYEFELDSQRPYLLEVITEGYDSHKESFTAPKLVDEDLVFERNVKLRKPAKPVEPEVIPPPTSMPEIMHVYFDFDQHSLRPESKREIEMVADLLNRNPDLSVRIMGHTDWYGTYDYNVDLSHNRANATIRYLESLGVSAKRASSDYFSEVKPIATNENDDGRQYNRRVEFQFLRGNEVVFTSSRLRTGIEGVRVDHTLPKGLPGFDQGGPNPSASNDGGSSETSTPAIPSGSESSAASSSSSASLRNIYFDFDRSELRGESVTELNKIASLLKEHADWTLTIGGHTDSYGTNDYNDGLSRSRSIAAYAYLLDMGISKERLAMENFSEDKPIDTNNSDVGRQNNRRVEFLLSDKNGIVLRSSR